MCVCVCNLFLVNQGMFEALRFPTRFKPIEGPSEMEHIDDKACDEESTFRALLAFYGNCVHTLGKLPASAYLTTSST